MLSILCGTNPSTDEAIWTLRSGEAHTSPVIWKHLTSDCELIHEVIAQESAAAGDQPSAAVIPDFLRPAADRAQPEAHGQMAADFSNSWQMSPLPTPAPVAPMAPQPIVPPAVPAGGNIELPGTVFADRYEIIEEIGQGAMGRVYKAKQRIMDRFVALKVLHPHLLMQDANKLRFENEARASASLSHPNLIHIYDCGTNQGRPFIVMDYLDGPSLEDLLLHSQILSQEEVVDIFTQICRGLSHAHNKGIIHRDLKPSNVILVEGDGNTVIVKVLDFGIAKAIKSSGVSEQRLTHMGDVVGSPLYMSPEQCKGEELDGRSDIYALGCMMYQALVGTLPFAGADPMETMFKHVYADAPGFEQVRPDVPIAAELQRIVFKALERETEKRYANADALENDLLRFAAGKTVSPVVSPPAPQAERSAAQHSVPSSPFVPSSQRRPVVTAAETESAAAGSPEDASSPAPLPHAQDSLESQSEPVAFEVSVTAEELLCRAGIISQQDLDYALRLAEEVGGDASNILLGAGRVQPTVLNASRKCLALVERGLCDVTQAVVLVSFCHRAKLPFEDCLKKLGWELPPL